jgi:hypothetical protein
MSVHTALRIRTHRCLHWRANRDEQRLDGSEAVRVPQYTSAGMHAVACKHPGLCESAAKSRKWWDSGALDVAPTFVRRESVMAVR